MVDDFPENDLYSWTVDGRQSSTVKCLIVLDFIFCYFVFSESSSMSMICSLFFFFFSPKGNECFLPIFCRYIFGIKALEN